MNGGDYAGGYGNPRDPLTRKQGWQQSGKVTWGNPAQVATMQADFTTALGSGPYTIQFQVDVPAALQGKPINPVADITWTVEGGQVLRRVSVGNGTTVTGIAQSVHVRVTDQAGGFGDGHTQYGISIQCAPGTRPAVNQPAILTSFNAAAAPGGNPYIYTAPLGGLVAVPVPQNVGVISVLVTVAANPFGAIPQGSAMAVQTQGVFGVKEWDTTIQVEWIPVAPGVDTLFLEDDPQVGAPGHIDYTVTWGIDG